MNVFMHAQVRQNLTTKLQLVRGLIDQNVATINELKARIPRLRQRKEAQTTQDDARTIRVRDRANAAQVAYQNAVNIPVPAVPPEPQRPAGMIDCNATNGDEYWMAYLAHHKVVLNPMDLRFQIFQHQYGRVSVADFRAVQQYKANKAAREAAVVANNNRAQQVEAARVTHQAAIQVEQTHRTDSNARVVAADAEINRVKGEVNALAAKIASLIRLEGLLGKMLNEQSNKEARISGLVEALRTQLANQDLPTEINLRESVDLIDVKQRELSVSSQKKWARFARESQSPATLLAVGAFMLTILGAGEISLRSMMMALIVMAGVYGSVNALKERVDTAENQLESIAQSIESISVQATEFMNKFMNLAELTSQTAVSELQAMRRSVDDGITRADRHVIHAGILGVGATRRFEAIGQSIPPAIRDAGASIAQGIRDACVIL